MSQMVAQKGASKRSMLSAGILAYRDGARGLEVLLVHPGGPFWRNKDNGAWSIPKGEMGGSDDPEQVARREFAEELGPSVSIGHPLQPLGDVRQRGRKRVIAFAGKCDFEPSALKSNTFDLEWPPKAVDCRASRKLIARTGSISTPLGRRCCPRRGIL
jgi:predicted NUDIX family NTP pyrophosphohydrolase